MAEPPTNPANDNQSDKASEMRREAALARDFENIFEGIATLIPQAERDRLQRLRTEASQEREVIDHGDDEEWTDDDWARDNGAPSKAERERDERYYKTREGFSAAAAENTDPKQEALREIAKRLASEKPHTAQPPKDYER